MSWWPFQGPSSSDFLVPLTSWVRGHIYVDFFILKFSKKVQNGFNIATRMCGDHSVSFLIGWNLVKYGMDLQKSGEVSPTLQMPFYPVAYGLAVSCFIQCLVMVCDIVKIFGGKYE